MTPQNPPPGSAEAIQIGCSCSVLDNARGRGFNGRKGVYVITDDCKVHGSRADERSERAL